ncbi:MAG: cupin domain-containing protein [Candidatus Cloacimonetes bacterium]|nr:cupin domain-containing protein [Candidatus Cloacimonadota bacterium]
MLIKDLKNCQHFTAIDNSTLCEFLHPTKQDKDLKIPYSIAHAIVKSGEKTLPHKLKISSEVYFILEGEGIIYIDDEYAKIHSGQAIYIPPNSKQYIQSTGNSDLKFLCIMYPMWRLEDEKLIVSK